MPGAPSPLLSLAACSEDLLLEALQQSHMEHLLEPVAVGPAPPEACGEGLVMVVPCPGEGRPNREGAGQGSYSCPPAVLRPSAAHRGTGTSVCGGGAPDGG